MVAILSIVCAILALIAAFLAFIMFFINEKVGTIISFISAIFLAIISVMAGFNVNVPEPNIYPLDNETRTLHSEEEISIISDDGYTVYYSLDGSDPKDGFKYEEPFTINETLTVCARAKNLFWWSNIKKAPYHFTDIPKENNIYSLKKGNNSGKKHIRTKTYMETVTIVDTPTFEPTMIPTPEPTSIPTAEPTMMPSPTPTIVPTPEPTVTPTEEPQILPPDLLGMDEPTAINTCIQNGYKYDVEYYLGGSGTVISQSPSKNENIEPGDSISINIGISQDDFTNKLLELINNKRNSLGLNQLILNDIYTQGTQILASENVTSNYEDCTRPDGRHWDSVYTDDLNVAITGHFTTRNNISSLSNANNRIRYTDDCLLNPEFCYIGIAYSDSNMLVIVVGSGLITY